MKQLLILLLVGLLTSCGADKYTVKLNNGSTVKAEDRHNRDYTVGDTVCLKYPSFYDQCWLVDTRGEFKDTTYVTISGSTIDYRIGVIKGKD
jgi:hypothetical protein